MKKNLLRITIFITVIVFLCAGCDGQTNGDIPVTFISLETNGSEIITTTKLTLTFNNDIEGLITADITLNSGSTGAVKGILTRIEIGVYELTVNNINSSGDISVSVSKYGYNISGSPKTVAVYYSSSGGIDDITAAFNNLEADGSASETTTILTLTFDKDIEGLTASDIAFDAGSTGAVKGVLTRIETGIYELVISGINASGNVTVSVTKTGYAITSGTKTVAVFYYATSADITVEFISLTANGSDTETTTLLTLIFDKDIEGLTTDDITIDAGSTGAVKGLLSRTGIGTYELAVSGVIQGGNVTITIADKPGYVISANHRTAVLKYADIPIIFISLTADGSETETTTKLILTFDNDIDNFTVADIYIDAVSTGTTKGELTKTGTGIYELAVTNIIQNGTIMVSVIDKSGNNINQNTKYVEIFVVPVTNTLIITYTSTNDISFLFFPHFYGNFSKSEEQAYLTFTNNNLIAYRYEVFVGDIKIAPDAATERSITLYAINPAFVPGINWITLIVYDSNEIPYSVECTVFVGN